MTHEITGISVFSRHPDVRYRVIDGEGVLIRYDTGEILGLNAVGTRLFVLINAERPAREVIERLADEFDVDRKELEPDILAFFEELLSAGLIVRAPVKAIQTERCCER